jgi:hypothetical protein
VGSYSIATEPVLSWKCRMAAITNVRIRSHLLEGFPSDELNNVLKKCLRNFAAEH